MLVLLLLGEFRYLIERPPVIIRPLLRKSQHVLLVVCVSWSGDGEAFEELRDARIAPIAGGWWQFLRQLRDEFVPRERADRLQRGHVDGAQALTVGGALLPSAQG